MGVGHSDETSGNARDRRLVSLKRPRLEPRAPPPKDAVGEFTGQLQSKGGSSPPTSHRRKLRSAPASEPSSGVACASRNGICATIARQSRQERPAKGANSTLDLRQLQQPVAPANRYQQHHHLGRYSSSQAQLQSLTGRPEKTPNVSAATSGDTNASEQQQQQLLQLQQAARLQCRSQQLSLATKPMAPMLNEPSFFATIGRLQTRPTLPAPRPVAAPLPPPYNSVDGTADSQQMGATQQASTQQQQVITCRQAQSSAHHQSTESANQASAGGGAPRSVGQTGATNPAQFPVPQAASQHQFQFQQQHMMSLLASQAAHNLQPFNLQQQLPFLQQQQQQQQPLAAAAAAAEPSCSAAALQQQISSPSGAALKPKSCLTCADISIKWYIVVIALLGLICALIGTIVGAVHSAGRDYISLALLLVGVGLVLVAISWIALRITIKTYKGNARPSSLRAQLAPSQPALPALMQTQMGRLLRPANQRQVGANCPASLHRNLLNERLYMMAAAASAAALITRQSAPTESQQAAEQRISMEEATRRRASLMSSIKQRLPRRLVSLISPNTLSAGPSAQEAQLLATPSNRLRAAAQPAELQHQQLNPNALANLDQSGPNSSPATAMAAAALLHQYQTTLLPPHHPAFVFPPPAHLFGFGSLAGSDFPFRPPPPSYSAAMQDHRFRMLLQERSALQHLSSMFPSANVAPQLPQAAPQSHQPASQAAAAANPSEPSSDGYLIEENRLVQHQTGQAGALGHQEAGRAMAGQQPKAAEPESGELVGRAYQPARSLNSPLHLKGDEGRRLEAAGSLAGPSSPTGGALVTNDIYVPLGAAGDLDRQAAGSQFARVQGRQREASAPKHSIGSNSVAHSNSTIVNIGPNATTIERSQAGNHNNTIETTKTSQFSPRKSQVKILGYL